MKALGGSDQQEIIAVAELLGSFAIAGTRWREWVGRMVVYVSDNQNVVDWLTTRQAGNRLARHVLRILAYLMVEGKFRLLPAHIRTYHNEYLDFVS